jgi:precorrin-2 dehydrogenase / sirohydrochlorin ferrochelatase
VSDENVGSGPPPGPPPPSPPMLVGLRLAGVRVLVVGGGAVATRRVERLVEAGAEVTVVAPHASAAIQAGQVRWHRRRYQPEDLTGAVLVVVATGHQEVDESVAREAREAGLWVNDATEAERGNVVFPAIAAQRDVAVAVSTGGQSPALARAVAAELERELVPSVADAAELMGAVRGAVRAAGRPTTHPGWQAAIDGGLLDLIRSGDLAGAEALLRTMLDLDGPTPDPEGS